MKTRFFGMLALLGACSMAEALEVGYPFGDHMVLQRGAELPVWGTADAGAQVSVKFGNSEVKATAGSDGKWLVKLPEMKANEVGQELQISSGSDSKIFKDVLVGDVWYASGQSNMNWQLKLCATGEAAIADSADEGLRLYNHTGTLLAEAFKYKLEDVKNYDESKYYASHGWEVSSPSTSGEMSGVAYFFAKKLRSELKVPIGILDMSMGGSPIEAHISKSELESDERLSGLLKHWWTSEDFPVWCRNRAAYNLAEWAADPSLKDKAPPHPFAPTFLSRNGPERFQPLPIKGVIWYQGESNTGTLGTAEGAIDGALNKQKFKMLVRGWRDGWKNQELPVYHVQLPGFNQQWSVFREMQLEATRELPNMGMVVAIDVGNPRDIHPNRKRPVGNRLARLALAKTYGQDIVPNGPLYKRIKVKGCSVFVDFENSVGLKQSDGPAIRGFEIAGADKKFYPAAAEVEGQYLKVTSKDVAAPVAVRYGWANDPDCNLVNGEGLPASPFRSDRWKNVEPTGNVAEGRVILAAAAAVKKSELIRVACIGDSITYGLGIASRDMVYPVQLQRLLGDKYEVRNFGNSSRSIMKKSMHGSQKGSYFFTNEHKQALAYQPHIVICNLGVNDLTDFDKFGSELKDDYKELLGEYMNLDSKPRVIAWSKIAPLFKGQMHFGSPNLVKINKAIDKAAKELDIETIDMEKPLLGKDDLFPDKLHPTAEGATIIAEVTAKFLQK